MEKELPYPNAENMVKYWEFRKKDAIHALECAIIQLDCFKKCEEKNQAALNDSQEQQTQPLV